MPLGQLWGMGPSKKEKKEIKMLQLTASSQSFSLSPVSLFLFPPFYSLPSRYSLRDLIQMAFCALKQLSLMSFLTEDGLQPDYKWSLPSPWP